MSAKEVARTVRHFGVSKSTTKNKEISKKREKKKKERK